MALIHAICPVRPELVEGLLRMKSVFRKEALRQAQGERKLGEAAVKFKKPKTFKKPIVSNP
jgi:hypothetical protein